MIYTKKGDAETRQVFIYLSQKKIFSFHLLDPGGLQLWELVLCMLHCAMLRSYKRMVSNLPLTISISTLLSELRPYLLINK